MATPIVNNYDQFQSDFYRDTGKLAKAYPELYIHYFHARVADRQSQYTRILTDELINRLTHLPSSLKKEMFEMVKDLKEGKIL